MKSKKKFAVSENQILRKAESDYYLDLRVRRKISSNPLLQKNYYCLYNYNNILRKPFYQQFGDANTYFKNTLRKEPFNIFRELNLPSLSLKQNKSSENLNKRQFRSRYTLVTTKTTFKKSPIFQLEHLSKQKDDSFKELYSASHKGESDSETEATGKDYFTTKSKKSTSYLDHHSEEEYTQQVTGDTLSKNIYSIFENPKLRYMMAEDETNFDEEYEAFNNEDNENPVDAQSNVDDENMDNDRTTLENVPEEATDEEKFDESNGESDDDEMNNVEKMIEAASQELQQVVEENEKIMGAMEGEEEDEEAVDFSKSPTEGGDGSFFKFDPAIDSEVLRELESAENQAKETAQIINELRNRISELLKKEQMTQIEAKELEEKNKLLKSQMVLFEQKIKRIQFLIRQTNLFENMIPAQPSLQKKHKVDELPKVIVCGLSENNMTKIIVCDDNKTKIKKKSTKRTVQPVCSPRTEIAKKLSDCYCMQEKLAAENADLEGKRYELQSDLLNKDQTVEYLQKQLTSLQTEMRMISQENRMLHSKLQQGLPISLMKCPNHSQQHSARLPQTSRIQEQPCGKGKGICPADIESRLQEYSRNTENLEKQLGDVEYEVKNFQRELTAVQKERQHLEHHRKMLCPPSPCAVPPCIIKHPCMQTEEEKSKSDLQLKGLKEQYDRLQDDFKGKLMEVASLRAENEKLKDTTKAAEETKKAAESKLKDLEVEMKKIKGQTRSGVGSREQLIEMEQQLNVSKQRFREAQDELEELRSMVEDQKSQASDYRNKYLEAQQTVEEQKRQIDLMEIENQHVSEQVNLEIQRVKNQFQEKLQELMPLPDILKSTQLKLKEAQQMHLLAERNNESMARELQQYKNKVEAFTSQMDKVNSDQQFEANENASLLQKLQDLQEEIEQLRIKRSEQNNQLEELTEKAEENDRLAEERLHEIAQLESQLENVREESARQVARTKDRCEIVRKSMQNEINELERQIAQSKAIAKAAQKDRDDIRQKMQSQINNLNENFEDAQMRIKNLQGHVNFLKNTYGDIYATNKSEVINQKGGDPCNCYTDY